MDKKKLLFDNVMIYGISNVVSKIVPFLFLPIILLLIDSPSNYAIYTTFLTIVGLGTPLVVFGMYDAVFREYFENEDFQYKKMVLSTSLRFTVFTSLIVSLIFLGGANFILYLFGINDILIIYLALLSLIINGFISVYSLPTRLKNDRRTFVVMGTIVPIILYGFSLLTLFLGLSYFGLIISSIIANLFNLLVYFILNNKNFNYKGYSKDILKKLLKIASPLVPLFIIYWLYNSLDRIMIVQTLGLDSLGIYSLASKFGSISSIIYISFAGGFQHFSFSTMKESNQIQNNTKLLNLILLTCSFLFGLLILLIDYLFKILFPQDYILASNSSIFLFISPLLLLSFQIVGNQFLIARKSYVLLISLVIGLIANFMLNFLFIPIYGIFGASYATFLGFFINLFVSIIYAKYRNLLTFSYNLSMNLLILFLFSLVVFFVKVYLIKILITTILFSFSLFINIEIITTVLKYLKSLINFNIKTN